MENIVYRGVTIYRKGKNKYVCKHMSFNTQKSAREFIDKFMFIVYKV